MEMKVNAHTFQTHHRRARSDKSSSPNYSKHFRERNQKFRKHDGPRTFKVKLLMVLAVPFAAQGNVYQRTRRQGVKKSSDFFRWCVTFLFNNVRGHPLRVPTPLRPRHVPLLTRARPLPLPLLSRCACFLHVFPPMTCGGGGGEQNL